MDTEDFYEGPLSDCCHSPEENGRCMECYARGKISIGTPTGNNFGTDVSWEDHKILSVEKNPNNSIVPFSYKTCCGKYIPTSAADGHWENSLHFGGYKIQKT